MADPDYLKIRTGEKLRAAERKEKNREHKSEVEDMLIMKKKISIIGITDCILYFVFCISRNIPYHKVRTGIDCMGIYDDPKCSGSAFGIIRTLHACININCS